MGGVQEGMGVGRGKWTGLLTKLSSTFSLTDIVSGANVQTGYAGGIHGLFG